MEGIQAYLAEVLEGRDSVSDQEIVELKKEYRRKYLAQYRKKYNLKNHQISFTLSNTDYNNIEAIAHSKKLRIATYAKNLLLHPYVGDFNYARARYELYQMRDIIEEAIYENTNVDTKRLETHIINLQIILDDSENNKS